MENSIEAELQALLKGAELCIEMRLHTVIKESICLILIGSLQTIRKPIMGFYNYMEKINSSTHLDSLVESELLSNSKQSGSKRISTDGVL